MFVCFSCSRQNQIEHVKGSNLPKQSAANVELTEIIIIDGCEYISYCLYCETGLLTHKGNCKNHVK